MTGLVCLTCGVCSGHITEIGQAVLVIPCVNDPRASLECLCMQLLSLHVQSHVSNLKKKWGLCVTFLLNLFVNINILISRTAVSYGSQNTA